MPTLAPKAFGLGRFHSWVWHHSPWWGLLCGLGLLCLQVGRSQWGSDFTLVGRKVYLLLPESAQVHIRVQERVTITLFEDWVC